MPGQHGGQPLPILLGELAEFGGQPCQRVALVDPFAFVLVPGAENVGGLWRCAERTASRASAFAFSGSLVQTLVQTGKGVGVSADLYVSRCGRILTRWKSQVRVQCRPLHLTPCRNLD